MLNVEILEQRDKFVYWDLWENLDHEQPLDDAVSRIKSKSSHTVALMKEIVKD